jgi:hypothetical protein
MHAEPVATPSAPVVAKDDGSGGHRYALIAVGPQGRKTAPSTEVHAEGLAELHWGSAPGADAYIIVRDGKEIAGPLRIEGAEKIWVDRPR